MRLGRGSQFAITLESCSMAAVGATSATCGGAHGISTTALAVNAVGISCCVGNNATFSGFNKSPARGAGDMSVRAGVAKSPLVDRAPGSPRGLQFPHALCGIDEAAVREYVNESIARSRHIVPNQRRDAWIVKKAWAPVPANHIPCYNQARMPRMTGLCISEALLPHSVLPRGPPRPS